MARIVVWIVCFAILGPVVGCSPSKIKITGKLTKKGQDFATHDKMLVTLKFVPTAESTVQSYPGKFHATDGSYFADIPPGKYKTFLVLFDYSKQPPMPVAVRKDFNQPVHDLTSPKELNLDIDP